MINVPMQVDDKKLMPSRGHEADAGLDLRAAESVVIPVKQSRVIGTGVRVNIPAGYVGYLHIRSGMGFVYDVQLSNSTGVIDAGFIGEIKAKVINHGKSPMHIERRERFCQLVVHELPALNFMLVDDLGDTARGDAGFGSTGAA